MLQPNHKWPRRHAKPENKHEQKATKVNEKDRKEAAGHTAEHTASLDKEAKSMDQALFSKSSVFDINFDEMDDKPWTRNNNLEAYFNHGLTEEEWLEYRKQQLAIRNELVVANHPKRSPDPAITPAVGSHRGKNVHTRKRPRDDTNTRPT